MKTIHNALGTILLSGRHFQAYMGRVVRLVMVVAQRALNTRMVLACAIPYRDVPVKIVLDD